VGPSLSSLARGAVAGALGTLAMDLVWYRRSRAAGDDSDFLSWELTGPIASWDDAPAPAQMGRKVLEAVGGREVPVERAALVNNLMHWGYGTTWTAGYALVPGRRAWWHGPAFGALVWASDYVTLPLAGVYEPIWRYDVATLWQDLSAHLVFGAAADVALRAVPAP
jgi:hypothetical protein